MTDTQATSSRVRRDILWIVLFLIIFVNGFESGGYQASLYSVGQEYDLSTTSMGLFAAIELLADMLAPLLLGAWVDRTGKAKSMKIILVIQLIATALVLFTRTSQLFVGSMFLLGLTTSTMQFTAIATVADAYPRTGKRKIGYITSMYALGAVVAPIVVSFYLDLGAGWRMLFAVLGIATIIALAGIWRSGADAREEAETTETQRSTGRFIIGGILLLCVIMCIYVGFENGFSFFVDTLFTDTFNASTGKLALSLYWAVMIPSRLLVGRFSHHAKKILVASIIAIPCVTGLIALSTSSWMVMALVVPLGFASGAIYPCVLTMMLPFAGKKTATATGMITAATGIGGFAFTALTGFMADQWGMQIAMAALATFFVISLVAALGAIKMQKKEAPTAEVEAETTTEEEPSDLES